MRHKSHEKSDTASYMVEIFFELLVYVPRLLFRLVRWIID